MYFWMVYEKFYQVYKCLESGSPQMYMNTAVNPGLSNHPFDCQQQPLDADPCLDTGSHLHRFDCPFKPVLNIAYQGNVSS